LYGCQGHHGSDISWCELVEHIGLWLWLWAVWLWAGMDEYPVTTSKPGTQTHAMHTHAVHQSTFLIGNSVACKLSCSNMAINCNTHMTPPVHHMSLHYYLPASGLCLL
jgi:hypothetical protein